MPAPGGKALTVMGLDPGSRATGFGVVREVSGQVQFVAAGVIRSRDGEDLGPRLGRIYAKVAELIAAHCPCEAAVENVFVPPASKSAQSALKLGQARGAAIAACAVSGLEVHSYEPSLVKKSLVGQGRADKAQVAFMVGRILDLKDALAVDASDALAVAICHLNMRRARRMGAA